MAKTKLGDQYYGQIGTFVDLVSQTSSKTGMKLKIALVAMQCDSLEGCSDSEAHLLEITKDHLRDLNSKVFLLKDVIKTSSQCVTREMMENLHKKVALVCSDSQLKAAPEELRPLSWHKFLNAITEFPQMTLEDAKLYWEDEGNEVGQAENISPAECETLDKLLKIIRAMIKHEETVSKDTDKESSSKAREGKIPVTIIKEEEESEEVTELNGDTQPDVARITVGEKQKHKGNTDTKDKTDFVDEKLNETKSILSYFSDYGEIVWFQGHPNLENNVITKPMEFVKSLRSVISHRVKEKFRDVKLKEKGQDLLKKGCISYEVFSEVYKESEKSITARDAWMFMKELGLAFPIEVSAEKCKEKDETVMVPCLIKDEMGQKVKKQTQKLESSDTSLCLTYEFNRNRSTLCVYYKLLKEFSKTFFSNGGGDFHVAFSQKIEERRLGTVAGIQGTLRWTTKCIQEPDHYNFQLLEHESPLDAFENAASKPFALNREVRFYLQPESGEMTEDMFSIMEKMDAAFAPFLGEVQRRLTCRDCQEEGIPGYFTVQAGIVLQKAETMKCSQQEHSLGRGLKELLKRKERPFEMKNLLDVEKYALGLQTFEESEIKKDMLSGKLKSGEQIWIYHDSTTNPCNLIARYNTYAHCVVYVGAQQGVHEVVHIGRAPLTRGLMKAKIRRQNVEDVINPSDQVFLGHKIPRCAVSANLREKIVERALECTKKPSLVFDYHYR